MFLSTFSKVEHLTKDFELDEDLFESAKGSLIFGIIEKEQSITDLVDQSLLASFRGLPADFSRFGLSSSSDQ
jgi:hypothetical protein